jgi:hypothetical protein
MRTSSAAAWGSSSCRSIDQPNLDLQIVALDVTELAEAAPEYLDQALERRPAVN